jgi:DNA ligase-associated metallophosphoesterase
VTIFIRDQEVILDKERAIYLPKEQLLAISDLHLGKAAHFRKAGFAIPNAVSQKDLNRLKYLIEKFDPKRLLINGDMFHSDYNSEINDFALWRQAFKNLEIILVKGNHDKQKVELYERLAINVVERSFDIAGFKFIHDIANCEVDKYVIGGHLHPGISIYNNAKQRLKFPCFYFGEKSAILPAFSHFTGLHLIKPQPSDQVFAVTPNSVVRL